METFPNLMFDYLFISQNHRRMMPTITHHQWTKEKASAGKFITKQFFHLHPTLTVRFICIWVNQNQPKHTINHKIVQIITWLVFIYFILLHSTLFVVLSTSRNYTAFCQCELSYRHNRNSYSSAGRPANK